jgi:hypothetical protein
MPPFLKIGQKYINPARINAIVVGTTVVEIDRTERVITKVTMYFDDDNHSVYSDNADALLNWLADYSLELDTVPA